MDKNETATESDDQTRDLIATRLAAYAGEHSDEIAARDVIRHAHDLVAILGAPGDAQAGLRRRLYGAIGLAAELESYVRGSSLDLRGIARVSEQIRAIGAVGDEVMSAAIEDASGDAVAVPAESARTCEAAPHIVELLLAALHLDWRACARAIVEYGHVVGDHGRLGVCGDGPWMLRGNA